MASKKGSTIPVADIAVLLFGVAFLLSIPMSTTPAVNAGFGCIFVVGGSAELYKTYLERRRSADPGFTARARVTVDGIVGITMPLTMAGMFGVVLWGVIPGWATCAIVATLLAMSGMSLMGTLPARKRSIDKGSTASDSPTKS